MINITALCWKQPTKKGYPIRLRILDTISKESKYIGLKLYLPDLKHWNENKKEVRKSFNDFKEYNDKINQKLDETKLLYSHTETREQVKAIQDINKINFIEALDIQIETLETQNRFGYKKRFTSLKGNLVKFLKKQNKEVLYFDEINKPFLDKFANYLTRNNVSFTTQKESYFKAFSLVFNNIIKDNQLTCFNPFSIFTIPKDKGTKEKTLNETQLKGIINYYLEGDTDNKAYLAKLLFLFSFYNQGIRPKDLFGSIKWKNIVIEYDWNGEEEIPKSAYLFYRMSKTDTDIKIELTNESLLILRYFLDYGFQYMCELFSNQTEAVNDDDFSCWLAFSPDDIENQELFKDCEFIEPSAPKYIQHVKTIIREQKKRFDNEYIFSNINPNKEGKPLYHAISYEITKYNRNLKKLASTLDINLNLTAYVSRHTFASLLLKRENDVFLISKLLGHSDIKITQTYLKSLNSSNYNTTAVKSMISDLQTDPDICNKSLNKNN